MKLIALLIVTLAAWPAMAQTRCVILNSEGTAISAGPMPPSDSGDCRDYSGNVTLITTGDSRWIAWIAAQAAKAAKFQ